MPALPRRLPRSIPKLGTCSAARFKASNRSSSRVVISLSTSSHRPASRTSSSPKTSTRFTSTRSIRAPQPSRSMSTAANGASPAPAPEPASEAQPQPQIADSVAPASAPKPGAEKKMEPEQPALPPLTPEEFRGYNRLADIMERFHNHFRSSWTLLYTSCTNNRRPARMSLRQFLDEGLSLVRYLTAHHEIEESYLYPILARKMPSFRAASRGTPDCKLVRQHRAIHKGMDEFEAYLRACKSGEIDFEMSVLKEKMDSWGDVLFVHLDEEVDELRAENMRKYWTIAEVKAIPV